MDFFKSKIARGVLLSLALLWLAACAAAPEEKKVRVLWPLPPDKPRIEWLGTYYSEDSFPKSAAQKKLESIVGKPPLTILMSPAGIASDAKGRVYVADALGRAVKVFDFNNFTVGDLSKDDQFAMPAGMAIDADGNIYVCDLKRKLVLVFSPEHNLRRVLGEKDGFLSPSYIAIDDVRDRVYVSDSRANRIVVYDRAGKTVQILGPQLSDTQNLVNPQGLAVDRDGNLYVAMMLAAKIAVLDPDGKPLRMLGERGDKVYQFEAPKDLAFDSDGNLWVVDNRRQQIYTYNPEGRILLATGGVSRSGTSPLGFQAPAGIFIDRNDGIFVSDRLLRRFSSWQYLSERYLAENPISAEELAELERLQRETRQSPRK
jgi:DNA-binding beta-propeller fold protein YncE